MNKAILVTILLSLTANQAFAHSGRTDSSGGHKCSQKSKDKGLCTGYHYHNNFTKIDATSDKPISENEKTHTKKNKVLEAKSVTAKSVE